MKTMTFVKQCNPTKISAELKAANIVVTGVQTSPASTIVMAADDADESVIASVVAAHTYEPIKFGKRLVG